MTIGSRRKRADVLTRAELEVMEILWDAGASTVAEVRDRLPSNPAYTTVLTILSILLRKKKVKRTQEGRAHRYRAIVSREGSISSAVHDFVGRMFGGSGEALLVALIDSRQVTPDAVIRAAELLACPDEDP
jgi:BlaI family penicillinase repressor